MSVGPGIRQFISDSSHFSARLPLLTVTAALAACGGGGGGGQSPPPSISFSGSPLAVTAGDTATLNWATTDATECEGSGGWTGPRPVSGSEPVGPIRGETRFALTCTGAGGTRTAAVTLSVAAPVSTISGRVLIGSTTQVDSDTNDPLAPRTGNNSLATAQRLPNPAIVGGYVALAGRGPAGAAQPAGDPSDFYRVAFAGGQTIELIVATTDPVANDLDLYLLDGSGGVVDASLGTGRVERITVPSSGTYFVEVVAFEDATEGAANYRLSLGQTLATGASEALRLTDEFVPGELLARTRTGRGPASSGHRRSPAAALADAHKLVQIGGAPGRELHYRLADEAGGSRASARASTLAANAGSRADPGGCTPRFRTGELCRKWATLLALKRLRQDTAVAWAEPNWRLRTSAIPDDPAYARQRWHYEQIRLPAAWDIGQGDPAVTVAVIDSGIRVTHPDLASRLVDGRDFVRGANAADGDGIDEDPSDPGAAGPGTSLIFHGTHVAGTVAAAGNNGLGVTGAAWNTLLMPVRVLGDDGSGTLADIIQGIRYAAGLANDAGAVPSRRADIINLSLGALRSCSQAESDVIAAARAAGVVVVAAAGNEATSLPASPASCPGAIAVAAVNSANGRAFYSNFGNWVRVAAPGGDNTDRDGDGFPDAVFSTHASRQGNATVDTYDFLIGTSMAAPHVAGVLALMKAINPSLTPSAIDDLLNGELLTRDIGVPGSDSLGVGLIDAFKATQAATNTPPPLLPQLGLSPRSLNFGDVGTEAQVLASNTGGGALAISSIFIPAAWLRVIPEQVDGTGLGTYRIEVDRAGRSPGTYSSFVEFRSSAGDERVEILMQVSTSPVVANAGRQYVVLVDDATAQITQQLAVNAQGAAVNFAFANVTPIAYRLLIGSDMNNDGAICDDGEACGAYPVFGEPTLVEPTAADLAFETAFRTYGQAAANRLREAAGLEAGN